MTKNTNDKIRIFKFIIFSKYPKSLRNTVLPTSIIFYWFQNMKHTVSLEPWILSNDLPSRRKMLGTISDSQFFEIGTGYEACNLDRTFSFHRSQKVRSRVSHRKTLNSKGSRWSIEVVSRQFDLTLLRRLFGPIGSWHREVNEFLAGWSTPATRKKGLVRRPGNKKRKKGRKEKRGSESGYVRATKEAVTGTRG